MAFKKSTTTAGQYTRVDTLQALELAAKQYGVKIKENKPSLFRRTMDIISRPLYASAGVAEAIVKNVDSNPSNNENVLQEVWNGLSGQHQTTYSDVLKQVGIENKYARGIAGFALDVALDPTTYFGGSLVKGAGKLIGKTATATGKVATKLGAGRQVLAIEETAKTIKDALGKGFVFGYGTSKLDDGTRLSDVVMRKTNELGLLKDETVAKYVERFGAKLNQYSKDDVIKAGEILWKNRKLELAAKGGSKVDYIKPDSPVIEEILTKLKTSGQEISKLANIPEDKIFENYFPGIFAEGKKVGIGGINQLRTGGQNYLKKYEGKLEYENAIKNPIEALARTEFEVVRDVHNTAAMADIIDGFGLTTKAYKKALKAGEDLSQYVPITKNPNSAVSFYKTISKEGKDILAVGRPKVLGYLKKADAELVNNVLHPEMKTIDLLAKASGYDSFLTAFKGSVTSLFPAFHARNMASGYVQNYSVLGADAFNPRNIETGLALSSAKINKQLAFKNFTGTTQELRDILLKEFKGSTRYISDIGNYVDEMVDGTIRFNSKFNPMNAGRAVGGWIEFNQKANAVATALRQGSTVNEAIRLAEKAGFNYAKVTPFEAKVMRRLIPFYTFARKNAELQLTTMAKNPERILNQIKFANSLSTIFGGDKPTQEELAGIPPWALEGLGFKLQDGKFVSRFGLPMEEFISRVNDPIKSTLSSLNPLIKYQIEAKTGYDFFRERQIKDLNQADPVTAKLLLNEKTPQWLKDAFSVTSYQGKDSKTHYTADAKNLHLLRNLPTSRLQSTVSKLADGDLTLQNKMMAFLSGVKIEDINKELQDNFREKDLMSAYQDELKRRGLGFDWNMFLLNNSKIDQSVKTDIKAMEKAAREAKKIED